MSLRDLFLGLLPIANPPHEMEFFRKPYKMCQACDQVFKSSRDLCGLGAKPCTKSALCVISLLARCRKGEHAQKYLGFMMPMWPF